MPVCERLAVAIVPHPFSAPERGVRRPALALTTASFMRRTGSGTFAMITTGAGVRRPGDLMIRDPARAGLPAGSMVRWKLFTLPAGLVLREAGRLGAEDQEAVETLVRTALGLHPELPPGLTPSLQGAP